MLEILLGTYNSSRYLREQIDSIIGQTYEDWTLLVHDGGSTDDTVDIIRDYEKKDSRIHFLGQERLSSAENFAKLWRLSQQGYVMFSDHDDVWLDNKIALQMAAMKKAEAETPDKSILVFSDAKVVDDSLRPLCASSWAWQGLDSARTELRHLLLQNVAAGNNMLVNGKMRELCPEIPAAAVMHDHWLMLLASLLGRIVRMDASLLLYRQHRQNVLGANRVSVGYFSQRARKGVDRARRRVYCHVRQARALLESYGETIEDKAQRKTLEDFANLFSYSWLGRRLVVLRHGIFKSGLVRNIATLAYI